MIYRLNIFKCDCHPSDNKAIIAIDGKALLLFLIRAVAGGTTHIIIAISTMYSLILRQNKTDKKSNESTLIQNLLT